MTDRSRAIFNVSVEVNSFSTSYKSAENDERVTKKVDKDSSGHKLGKRKP